MPGRKNPAGIISRFDATSRRLFYRGGQRERLHDVLHPSLYEVMTFYEHLATG
jgi:hypothetical protein